MAPDACMDRTKGRLLALGLAEPISKISLTASNNDNISFCWCIRRLELHKPGQSRASLVYFSGLFLHLWGTTLSLEMNCGH